MLLYIIRHGDPIYETDSLTELGQRQARALARRLAVHGLDRVFSSPKGRARLTAAPTCELLGLEYSVEDWMSEDLAMADFGVARPDGRRTWIFHALQNTRFKDDPLLRDGEKWHESELLAGTNAEAGYRRIRENSDDFLARLGYAREGDAYRIASGSGERVAVFCHQGFGLLWLSQLLAIPPALFWSCFDLTHSCITILEFAGGGGDGGDDGRAAPMCLCLGDTSHLHEAGLPLRHNNAIDI